MNYFVRIIIIIERTLTSFNREPLLNDIIIPGYIYPPLKDLQISLKGFT